METDITLADQFILINGKRELDPAIRKAMRMPVGCRGNSISPDAPRDYAGREYMAEGHMEPIIKGITPTAGTDMKFKSFIVTDEEYDALFPGGTPVKELHENDRIRRELKAMTKERRAKILNHFVEGVTFK